MSVIAAVGLNRTSSLAVTIRRNRGYAVRSIGAMAPGPSVPPYSMPIRTLSKTRPEAVMREGPWWLTKARLGLILAGPWEGSPSRLGPSFDRHRPHSKVGSC
jgi:hypothetical protein